MLLTPFSNDDFAELNKSGLYFHPPITIINSKNYKDAILKTIKAGGCNCSRANFTGAYFAALKGINSIPNNWIKKTIPAKKILNQK